MTQLSCGDKVTDDNGGVEIFGRVVYWAPFDSSSAEIFIYNNGDPVNDAIVIIDTDTIPVENSDIGYYFLPLNVNIGDTVNYNLEVDNNLFNGFVILPDTASILHPEDFDSILFNSEYTAEWMRTSMADGYFVFLEEQDGLVAAVAETHFDTSAVLPGGNYLFLGLDRLWVESLNGDFEMGITPRDRVMPKGIVASSANFRDVHIY